MAYSGRITSQNFKAKSIQNLILKGWEFVLVMYLNLAKSLRFTKSRFEIKVMWGSKFKLLIANQSLVLNCWEWISFTVDSGLFEPVLIQIIWLFKMRW